MKKLLVLIAALVFCCAAAMAEPAAQVAYSQRCLAVQAAQKALRETYGITEDMNDYFIRVTEETEDGAFIVRWFPDPDTGSGLPFLLGVYEARVNPKGALTVSWTHDGESTDGGFEARVWGAPQLMLIMDEVRTQYHYTDALNIADDVAEQAGYVLGSYDPELDDGYDDSDDVFGIAYDLDALDKIARQAVAAWYPDADQSRMEYWDEDYPCSLHMLHGRPVALILYSLWGDPDNNDWTWGEGDGYYQVTINLENNAVEELCHTSGLAGNG